ncbi:MAG: hypothetical protein ACRDEA_16200 [Microcystaceae cyanobacterium]
MNIRLIIFSGIITALIGSMIGFAATKIGDPRFDRDKYGTEFYKNLEHKYALIGAGLGFVVGAGQECVRELKAQRDREIEEQDPWKKL